MYGGAWKTCRVSLSLPEELRPLEEWPCSNYYDHNGRSSRAVAALSESDMMRHVQNLLDINRYLTLQVLALPNWQPALPQESLPRTASRLGCCMSGRYLLRTLEQAQVLSQTSSYYFRGDFIGLNLSFGTYVGI